MLGRGKKMKGAAAAVGLNNTLHRGKCGILLVSLSKRTGLARSLNFSTRLPRAVCNTVGNRCSLPVCRRGSNLDIIPSYLSLSTIRARLVGRTKQRLVLTRLVGNRGRGFSCVLVSYPPSLSLLALGTLATSSQLVVPIRTRFLTVHKVTGLVRIIRGIRRHLGSSLSVTKILVARCSKEGGLGGDISRLMRRAFRNGIFDARVHGSVTLTRTPARKRSVFRCTPGSTKTRSCRGMYGRLLARVGWPCNGRRQFGGRCINQTSQKVERPSPVRNQTGENSGTRRDRGHTLWFYRKQGLSPRLGTSHSPREQFTGVNVTENCV